MTDETTQTTQSGGVYFWRLPEIVARTGLCRTTILDMEKAGQFPPSRQLGVRAIAWLSTEVTDWMLARPPVVATGKG